jgi:multiple sugar transport system permease protein
MVAVAAAFRRNRRPRRYYLSRLFTLWLPLAFFLVFTLLPFWYMLVISLKDQQTEVNNPAVFPFWPFHPNFDQYIDLFARTQFPRWALNTTVVASLSTLVSLTFGTLAGYALARLRFRGASLLGIISFVTYLVPQTLLFIPLNIVITRLPVPLSW